MELEELECFGSLRVNDSHELPGRRKDSRAGQIRKSKKRQKVPGAPTRQPAVSSHRGKESPCLDWKEMGKRA